MPTEDYLQILVPKAIDRGYGVIGVRSFDGVLYVKRSNMFYHVRIQKITYFPQWARVSAYTVISGVEQQRAAGDNGTIDIDIDATESDAVTLVLENNSIDTEVKYTVHLLGWQYGEE